MSGYPLRACRIDHIVFVSRYLCLLFALAFVAGCSTFYQTPAPIVEGTVQPVPMPQVTPPEPVAAEPVMPETGPAEVKPETEHAPPKKPHKPPPRVTREEAPPPPPPAPPPPPLIASRLLYAGQVKGLLDTEVQRPDGKVVGRAVDLLADAGGAARDIIVNLTGFMGVGDRKVNFPLGALRVKPAAQRAAGVLEIVPARTPPIDPAKPAQAVATPPGTVPLMDATVQRPNGGKVGRVVDVLIDGGAQPQAAVLDLGNLISPERRRIAADWSALHFVTKGKDVQIQLDLSDVQLNAAPAYAADQPIRAVSPAPPAQPAPSPPSTPPPAAGASAAARPNAADASRAGASRASAQATAPASRASR